MSDLLVIRADLGGPQLMRVRISKGRISEIGTDLATARSDQVIDAAGGAVLPGLHDHHLHLYAAAAARESIRLGPPQINDREGFARALVEADRRLPASAWVRGIGYHESVAGNLDRYYLDTLVLNRPIRVQHRSGSQWILNSRALETLSATEAVHEGLERDSTGSPTGRLTRMDRWLGESMDRLSLSLGGVSTDAARMGVTGFTDATPFTDVGQIDLLADSRARREIRQRVSVMTAPGRDMPCPGGLSVGPVKFLLDDIRLPNFDEFRILVIESHRAGRPVAIHCVTRVQMVLATAVLEDAGTIPGDRIEHGAVIPIDLIPTLARLGVTIVTNPGFIYDRGDTYATEVAEDDRHALYRCASLRAAGVRVAAGTDAPFGPPDPWTVARTCTSRKTRSGMTISPNERVDGWTALSMFLGSPGSPATLRTVAPGQIGDLCILFTPLQESLKALSADNVGSYGGGGRGNRR